VTLRAEGASFTAVFPRGTDEQEICRYLRIEDPLPAIYESISKDGQMREAIRRWNGLHLLAQDPWETTIAFIASSASNVAKIQRSIEKMCRSFGGRESFGGGRGSKFPTARALAGASLAELRRCEFGYRAKYIRETARAVAEGRVDLAAIEKMPTDLAKKALVENLDGIGPKVAGCVLLFSMGKDDAFPVDRHVQRAVSERYFGGARVTEKNAEAWGRQYFGRWAGYAQQYMFHERRLKSRLVSPPPSGSA
jgi:N-glycosylase/DNA lyase